MNFHLNRILEQYGISPAAEKRKWEQEIKKRERLAPYKFFPKAARRRLINWHHDLNHYQRMVISITLPIGAACITNALPWWLELFIWPLTICFSVWLGLWVWSDYDDRIENAGLESELSEIKETLKDMQADLGTTELHPYLQCIEDELAGIRFAIEESNREPEPDITGNRSTYQDWERSLK